MKTNQVKKFEVRRIQGAKLLRKGHSYSEIAKQLNVSRQSVRNWAQRIEVKWRDDRYVHSHHFGGMREEYLSKKSKFEIKYKELRSQKLGRPSCLSSTEMGRVKTKLRRGAKTYGFDTSIWTLDRISLMINQEFGCGDKFLSKPQAMRIIKHLGFTCKKPSKGDLENYSDWKKYRWYEHR